MRLDPSHFPSNTTIKNATRQVNRMGACVREAILKFNKTQLKLEVQVAILSSFSTLLQPPYCTSAVLFNCLTYEFIKVYYQRHARCIIKSNFACTELIGVQWRLGCSLRHLPYKSYSINHSNGVQYMVFIYELLVDPVHFKCSRLSKT